MLPVIEKVLLVVQPLGLAVMLIYTYGLFRRSLENTTLVNMLMGIMFGIAACVAMLSPIPIQEGIIVDIRNLFIGVAGAFFGLIGGGVTLLIGIAMRVVIGGDGMAIGVASMAFTAGMGAAWAYFVQPRMKNHLKAFFGLGIMIACNITLGIFLPSAVRIGFFVDLGPTLLIAYVLGSVLLGQLITRERYLIDEAKRLASEASTDPLTKLVNRATAAAAFSDLPRPKKQDHGQTMICIDVDRFKDINDRYGHLRGDKVLVDVATRLSACVRPNDILSRISGDEFLIVLHDVNTDQARAVANRCLTAVNGAPTTVDGVNINVSISVGAVWTDSKPNFTAFRETADGALYRAKALGRNCVSFETTRAFGVSARQHTA